jgi:hypothetical protein
MNLQLRLFPIPLLWQGLLTMPPPPTEGLLEGPRQTWRPSVEFRGAVRRPCHNVSITLLDQVRFGTPHEAAGRHELYSCAFSVIDLTFCALMT